MEDLSLHILDIAENAIRAKANLIIIEIEENDELVLRIKDNGEGMDAETLKMVTDPFYTTKEGKKAGLGVSLISMAAEQAGGTFQIESEPGVGTELIATFKTDHPDIKPMGDILSTLEALVIANPSIRFIFHYKKGEEIYSFDSRE
ncbi:ATP-binding protein [bacterium]|nr:ATP-binding protein [bacterium]